MCTRFDVSKMEWREAPNHPLEYEDVLRALDSMIENVLEYHPLR